MLAFARETHLSETSFIQSPAAPEATYRNRIWTVAEEVPFAGHPSLGTAVAEARLRGEGSAQYHQQTPAGVQALDVELREDGRGGRAELVCEPTEFLAEIEPVLIE